MTTAPYKLILLRHGESEWNAKNLFTGWVDVDLNDKGEKEAVRGGRAAQGAGLLPDVLHTSLLKRAIRTAQLCARRPTGTGFPVRRSWRLNERHYGALQGKDKAQTLASSARSSSCCGAARYDTPPPAAGPDGAEFSQLGDPRYADIPPELLPRTECLKDVVAPDAAVLVRRRSSRTCAAGRTVLVAAHGNSLRALVKHLDGISDEAIAGLNIPTGIPLLYELDDRLPPARPPAATTSTPTRQRRPSRRSRTRAAELGVSPPGAVGRWRRLQPATEGVEVAGGLAALDPPLVLLADRDGEAELEEHVEGPVRVLDHGAEQPVDLVRGHRGQRQPPAEIDVPELVDARNATPYSLRLRSSSQR